MSADPVAADYLGGHPDADLPVMGGELVVRDGALRFSGSRIEGLTPVAVAFTLGCPWWTGGGDRHRPAAGDAVRDARDDLPEVLEAAPGQDALLTEIRDLLARRVELLECLAARLAP